MRIARFAILAAIFTILASVSAKGEVVECRAKVALNRLYDVSLDTEKRTVKVVTDNGYRYEGATSYAFSPRTGSSTYFLATGFGTGLDIEIEGSAAGKVALCLNATECYACRRKTR